VSRSITVTDRPLPLAAAAAKAPARLAPITTMRLGLLR
jgi:hypothetical protein